MINSQSLFIWFYLKFLKFLSSYTCQIIIFLHLYRVLMCFFMWITGSTCINLICINTLFNKLFIEVGFYNFLIVCFLCLFILLTNFLIISKCWFFNSGDFLFRWVFFIFIMIFTIFILPFTFIITFASTLIVWQFVSRPAFSEFLRISQYFFVWRLILLLFSQW